MQVRFHMVTKNYEDMTTEELLEELHSKKQKIRDNLKQIAKLEAQMNSTE